QMPALNRFISGQRIYARNDIQCMMAVKKGLSIESEETVIKAFFMPDDTVETIFNKFQTLINETKQSEANNVESTAKFLMHLPRFLLKFAVWFLGLMDYFGILPKKLLDISPFHGSFFITSMGSLGIPVIYHHLYDFGNCPAFCCYGAKYYKTETDEKGEKSKHKCMDMTFVLDERICDGLYYATALKKMLKYIKEPELLDTEKINVIEDVD
ncbi:MAG: 2-oxoglutarate dehydrogenase, partial [Oscillospiraceae bacterium]|nr:2-oxoglutarate dehydrogenase [Candidatus Equicaccousia limihippi]